MQDLAQAQVFTPPWVTNQMLDLIGESTLESPDSFYFEPTCGDGQMLIVMVERIYKALFRVYQDHEKAFCETLFKFYATELDESLVPKARMRIYEWAVNNAGRPLTRIEEGLICLQLAQSIEWRDALKDSIPNIDTAPSMRALKRKAAR